MINLSLPIDTQTHFVSTHAVVAADGTVEFMGLTWYCHGAQPGWEVTLSTTISFNNTDPAANPGTLLFKSMGRDPEAFPEALWEATESTAISPFAAQAAIAERLPEGFFDSNYLHTYSEMEGYAFRLNPVTKD